MFLLVFPCLAQDSHQHPGPILSAPETSGDLHKVSKGKNYRARSSFLISCLASHQGLLTTSSLTLFIYTSSSDTPRRRSQSPNCADLSHTGLLSSLLLPCLSTAPVLTHPRHTHTHTALRAMSLCVEAPTPISFWNFNSPFSHR